MHKKTLEIVDLYRIFERNRNGKVQKIKIYV